MTAGSHGPRSVESNSASPVAKSHLLHCALQGHMPHLCCVKITTTSWLCTHTKAGLSNGNHVLVSTDENEEQGKHMVTPAPRSFPASGNLWLKDSLSKSWSLCIQ